MTNKSTFIHRYGVLPNNFYDLRKSNFKRPEVMGENQPTTGHFEKSTHFLIKCRRDDILPNHVIAAARRTSIGLDIPDRRAANRIFSFENRLKYKLLNIEIRTIHRVVSEKEQLLLQLQRKLDVILPHNIWNEFNRRQTLSYKKRFNSVKNKNMQKFNNLKLDQQIRIKTKPTWIKNLTDTAIPNDILEFLSLGPKFSLPTTVKDFPIVHTLAEIETITRNLEPKERNITLAKSTNIITNYIQAQIHSNNYLNVVMKTCQSFLNQNPDLLVLKADKGAVTVIMSKQQYRNLALDILNDTNSYSPLSRDPTSTIQQKANKIVTQLKKGNYIDAALARKSTIYNAVPPRFYGLPKIHKTPVKLRPIISSIDSPTSKISQLVASILTKAYNSENEYYIKDSFRFAELTNNKKLPDNYILVSLDVVSLFSNIPLDLVVKSVSNKWGAIEQHCDIPIEKFLELVTFIFKNTYFSYENRFYKQTLGAPMGGQASSIIATYVMDDLLDNCIPKLTFSIPLIKKYVDDLICSIPNDSQNEILEVFNAYNEHIQFTIENEDDHNSVPFLDTRVHRDQNNVIKLDWYRKPTSSGRYLNFNSSVSMKMKINLVTAMKNRIYYISHPDFYIKNLSILAEILNDNSYPKKLTRKLLNNQPERQIGDDREGRRSQEEIDENADPIRYGTLPNIDKLTPKLIGILKTNHNKIAVKNIKTIGRLFSKTKDKLGALEMSNVVYKVICRECQLPYIGQTSRNLKGRLTSHKSDCRTGKVTCALAEHVKNTNHQPNYDEVKILDIDNSSARRTFKEMVRIVQEDSSLNKKTDIDGLSHIYSYLIQIDKEKSHLRSPDISDADSSQ